MAIIACNECDRMVSDRAAICPNCGVPIAATAKAKPHGTRIIFGVLITCVALWLIGTTLWQITPGVPRQLIGMAKTFIQTAGHFVATDPSSGSESKAPHTVYQTTAEQLYQDYNANGVATQSRIGNGGIRVSGTVAEIVEDASGHAVVKLSTNNANSVDMTLTDDQTAAAAQLSRGQTVDIQCDKMHGVMGSPVGGQCTLALVNAASTAPSLGARETAPASPESVPRVAAPAATAGGRIHGHSAVAALPTSIPAQGASRQPPAQPTIAAAAAPVESATVPLARVAVPLPLSAPETTPVSQESDPSTAATPAPGAPDGSAEPATATAAARIQNGEATPVHLPPATEGSSPVQGASQEPTPPPTATVAPDDLATVRATDPAAADHIASYCATSTAVGNGAAFAAGCRRDERDAWTRLVLHNEFPTLDDVTRRKCNEPPFPDSFIAKETCAKYELNITTGTSAQR